MKLKQKIKKLLFIFFYNSIFLTLPTILIACDNKNTNVSNKQEWVWSNSVQHLKEVVEKTDEEFQNFFLIKSMYDFERNFNDETDDYNVYKVARNSDDLKFLRNKILEHKQTLFKETTKLNIIDIKPLDSIINLINKIKFIIELEEKKIIDKYQEEIFWSSIANIMYDLVLNSEIGILKEIEMLSKGEDNVDISLLYVPKFLDLFIQFINELENKTKIIKPIEFNDFQEQFYSGLESLKEIFKNKNLDFDTTYNKLSKEEVFLATKEFISIQKQQNPYGYYNLELMLNLIEIINNNQNSNDLLWIPLEVELTYLLKHNQTVKQIPNEQRYDASTNFNADSLIASLQYFDDLEIISKIQFPKKIRNLVNQLWELTK